MVLTGVLQTGVNHIGMLLAGVYPSGMFLARVHVTQVCTPYEHVYIWPIKDSPEVALNSLSGWIAGQGDLERSRGKEMKYITFISRSLSGNFPRPGGITRSTCFRFRSLLRHTHYNFDKSNCPKPLIRSLKGPLCCLWRGSRRDTNIELLLDWRLPILKVEHFIREPDMTEDTNIPIYDPLNGQVTAMLMCSGDLRLVSVSVEDIILDSWNASE
jgi:hypothetical protein